MTTLDIETFFAVLDHGTMTAAAEALFITQPTLTARIQALEAEVGAALFRRGKGQRHITLTEAGQRFLPLARRWQNLLKETQTFSSVERREFLHIIAVYTANQYILPPVYQRFLERGLPVSLWVESMRIYETVAAVARGDADMAIVDGDLHYDLQIEARPLFRESFFLVVPMDLRCRTRYIPPCSGWRMRYSSPASRRSSSGTTAGTAWTPARCCIPIFPSWRRRCPPAGGAGSSVPPQRRAIPSASSPPSVPCA